MTEFETVDIDGVICKFQYKIEISDDKEKIHFKVYSIPENEMSWFTYTVKIKDKGLVKSENMTFNSNKEFLKKGIPEKIIQIASKDLESSIISSPLNPKNGNFLIENSYKVWERLVEQDENAVLDSENDCFIYKRTD